MESDPSLVASPLLPSPSKSASSSDLSTAGLPPSVKASSTPFEFLVWFSFAEVGKIWGKIRRVYMARKPPPSAIGSRSLRVLLPVMVVVVV